VLRAITTTKRSQAILCLLLAGFLSSQDSLAQSRRNYPKPIVECLKAGSQLLDQGRFADARAMFQQATQMQPDCPEAYNNIGLTYYKEGKLSESGDAYMKALAIEPVFVPSITNLGVVRYQQRKLTEAANLYRLALRLCDGKDPELQYNLANVLRDQKNYSEAKKHYVESIKLRPDFAPGHNGLGATYYCLNDYTNAEKSVRQALSLQPQYALAYYHLGLIETAQGMYGDAMEAYEDSLRYETKKTYADDTRRKIADLQKLIDKKQNEKPPAGESPQQVATVADPGMSALSGSSPSNASTPTPTDGTRPEAIDLLEGGNFAKAEQEFKALVTHKDMASDAVVWNDYAFAMYNQNSPTKTDAAIKAYRKSISLSKGNLVQAHYNLAQALRLKGENHASEQEVLSAIKLAKAQNTMCPLVHNLHGILLKSRGRYKEAEEAYRVAIAQSMGRFPVFHYNRAILLEKLKKKDEAKREYDAYLKQSPNGQNAERARSRLSSL